MKFRIAVRSSRPWVCLLISLLGPGMAFAQDPLDEATLQSLRSKPQPEIEKFASEWADAQVSAHGRDGAADSLSQLVIRNPALAAQSSLLLRGFGKHLEPEFSENVLKQIGSTDESLVRGGLLLLLRDTAPENAPQIARWLTDERPGEDLEEQSKTAPKRKESIASGAVPFRVCDVAFNVIQEITATDESKVRLLTRSQSLDSRSEQIGEYLGVSTPSRTRPVKQPSSDPALPPGSHGEETGKRSTDAPLETPRGGMIAAALIAAIALLAWWLKRRK